MHLDMLSTLGDQDDYRSPQYSEVKTYGPFFLALAQQAFTLNHVGGFRSSLSGSEKPDDSRSMVS